jgi:hypothetical protein
VKPTRSRLAALEAAARTKLERNRPRGVINMTTGEKRQRLAELLFEKRYDRAPTAAELNAYRASPEHEADDRQEGAEFLAWWKAMPGAAASTWQPFLGSDKGKAALAAELEAFAAREAKGGVWYLEDEPEDATS